MQPRRRLRTSQLIKTGISLVAIQRVLQSVGCDIDRENDDGATSLDIITPFGPLLQEMEIPLDTGRPMKLLYAHPFALLHIMCQRSHTFFELLRRSIAQSSHNSLGVILYSDETTIGNQLHPDRPRELLCLYWTFLQLPAWFRSRKVGWWPFTFLKASMQYDISGGLSKLMASALEVFFCQRLNMLLGILLTSLTGVSMLLRATFSCFLQDEKAHKQTWDVKGASGSKFCLQCKNVLRGANMEAKLAGHPYLVYVGNARRADFDTHTADSFFEMVDVITEQRMVLGDTAFAKLEQAYGIIWNPEGLLWNPKMRALQVSPPTHTYWDWLHIAVGSGGVVQYAINRFVLKLKGHNITSHIIDRFHRCIVWPHSQKRLPAKFFQSRVVDSDTAHIKAFGHETIQALYVLVLFSDVYLMSTDPPTMERHVQCLTCLLLIIQIFQLGPQAVQYLDTLRQLVDQWFELYLELYGMALARKPKAHYMHHLADCIARFLDVLSCFAPERYHRYAKANGAHCYGEGNKLGSCTLRRCCVDHLEGLVDDDFAEACFLVKPQQCSDWEGMVAHYIPHVGSWRVSRKMQAGEFELCVGDLIAVGVDGQTTIGVSTLFASGIRFESGQRDFFALVQLCAAVGKDTWKPMGQLALVGAAAIIRPLPYVVEAGLMRICSVRLLGCTP